MFVLHRTEITKQAIYWVSCAEEVPSIIPFLSIRYFLLLKRDLRLARILCGTYIPSKRWNYCCTQAQHLKSHMLTHTEEKSFACKQCSYSSNHSNGLKYHMLSHTGEKPFACKLCNYSCKQSSRVDIWRDRCDRRSRKIFCELRKFLGKQCEKLYNSTPK